MAQETHISRRNFMKSTAVASSALLGAPALSACSGHSDSARKQTDFPLHFLKGYQAGDGVSGLLFSQIGYEPGFPVRIIVRLPEKELLPGNSVCRLLPVHGSERHQADLNHWGEIWGSHWWVADFGIMDQEGVWDIEVWNENRTVFADRGLRVGKNILWDSTIEWSSVDMLESRVHFTKVGAGWQDAGTLWVESPAQSAMVIALAELLENTPGRFDQAFRDRIHTQITVGSDYLVMTQKKAFEMGFPEGAFCHDLHGHEKDILPADAMKAVVALCMAARLLPDSFREKKEDYLESAKRAYRWLLTEAEPMGDYGYVRLQRGIPEDTKIPREEWLTRDLLMMCQAALEMHQSGDHGAKEQAVEYARKAMARQISREQARSGFYGHFREFESLEHSEPSWIHGIVPGKMGVEFGADLGGIYPNYLLPIIRLLELFPEHDEAGNWRESLHHFAYGYLIPGCEANPFFLVPQLIPVDEGPTWFCGTFHGTNAIYGYTAALALELEKLLHEPKLKAIAYGNLQWIAGLNAGITRENLETGCVVFSTDVPEGMALPASMVCHIGERWAGTWFQTRGVICNGFSTGKQFVYDTRPERISDGPHSLTDEDWIPHSAAWLTGLMRLQDNDH